MACPENVQRMADMSEKITFLDTYLRKPLWLDRTTSSLRVVFPSAQPTTLSSGTVTTVTSMTQKAGIGVYEYLVKPA